MILTTSRFFSYWILNAKTQQIRTKSDSLKKFKRKSFISLKFDWISFYFIIIQIAAFFLNFTRDRFWNINHFFSLTIQHESKRRKIRSNLDELVSLIDLNLEKHRWSTVVERSTCVEFAFQFLKFRFVAANDDLMALDSVELTNVSSSIRLESNGKTWKENLKKIKWNFSGKNSPHYNRHQQTQIEYHLLNLTQMDRALLPLDSSWQ